MNFIARILVLFKRSDFKNGHWDACVGFSRAVLFCMTVFVHHVPFQIDVDVTAGVQKNFLFRLMWVWPCEDPLPLLRVSSAPCSPMSCSVPSACDNVCGGQPCLQPSLLVAILWTC